MMTMLPEPRSVRPEPEARVAPIEAVAAARLRVAGRRLTLEVDLEDETRHPIGHLHAVIRAMAGAWAGYQVGVALVRAEQAEAALRHLNAAIRLFDRCPDFHLAAARAHARLGNWDEAIAACERAMHLAPYDRDAWLFCAELWLSRGEPSAASRALERAAAIAAGASDSPSPRKDIR